MNRLDPLSCLLNGRQLIEASAGTGKTFTIALLFLRLLLERGLELDQILVVTFTEAATQELRDRIRRRLREALDQLRQLSPTIMGRGEPPLLMKGRPAPDRSLTPTLSQGSLPGEGANERCATCTLTSDDPSLMQLLAGIEDHPAAARRLADALVRMDEAAVFTIHGFCARILREHAFDGGMDFEQEQITDEGPLRMEIMRDFWRQRLATLDRAQTRWLLEQWATPEQLLKALAEPLRHPELRLLPEVDLAGADAEWQRLEVQFQALRQEWASSRSEVVSLLTTTPALNRNSYSRPVLARALTAMDDLAACDRCPDSLEDPLERLTPTLLRDKTKSGQQAPTHALFDRVAALRDDLPRALQRRKAAWLGEALAELRQELSRRKERLQQVYFDDLLRHMDQGLGRQGPGERLAAAVRARYPVALIDEFQDTDPLQYRIFERLYPPGSDASLFLIGDPKQAIYSFRGADIFTYLRAQRRTAEGDRYSLGTNWRSADALVRAVNHLFSAASRPFFDAGIAFEPVMASGEADKAPLLLDGQTLSPLRFWLLPDGENGKALTGDPAKELAATACAGRIAELLNLAAAGRAQIGDAPLQARDIAVLVRSHDEGALVRDRLRQHGLASVSIGRESVFASDEARELEVLLLAVAEPGNGAQLRAALATRLLGQTLSAIAGLLADEAAWDRLQQRFAGYHDCWRRQGFMVALLQLLHRENLVRGLLATAGGERRITNLLHLAELIQLAASQRQGIEAALRWFAEQRAEASEADEKLLRLESDEALVRIVTIHSSKGLEYPLVFLPFPWNLRPSSKPSAGYLFHDAEGTLCYDLGSEEQEGHKALAWDEALAEQVRLFYVAVTRARHQCQLTWGRVNLAEHSAPAWLLHQQQREGTVQVVLPADREAVRQDLERLAQGSAGTIEIGDLPEFQGVRYQSQDAGAAPLALGRPRQAIVSDWRLASYSGLIHGLESERPDHDAGEAPAEVPTEAPVEAGPQALEVLDILRFPRGTRAGTFLHGLLERTDFQDLARAPVAEQLLRHGYGAHWLAPLQRLLNDLCATPLNGEGLCLGQIARPQRRDELGFAYPLAALSPAGLRGVLAEVAAYRTSAEGLEFSPLRGLMRGFIDLVFEHQGRFYLADYKSNHLGDRPQDYGPEALTAAIGAHRYDLQYLIYCVALHRYLGRRIRGYSYREHFGGVYYLFLRGIRPGSRNGIHFDRPEPALIAALDRLFAGRTP